MRICAKESLPVWLAATRQGVGSLIPRCSLRAYRIQLILQVQACNLLILHCIMLVQPCYFLQMLIFKKQLHLTTFNEYLISQFMLTDKNRDFVDNYLRAHVMNISNDISHLLLTALTIPLLHTQKHMTNILHKPTTFVLLNSSLPHRLDGRRVDSRHKAAEAIH